MKRIGILISALIAVGILVYGLTAGEIQARAQTHIPPAESTNLNVVTLADGEIQDTGDAALSVTIAFDQSADLPKTSPDAWGVLLDQTSSSYTISSKIAQVVNGKRICPQKDQVQGTQIMVKESTRYIEDVTDFGRAQAGNEPNHLYLQQVLKDVSQPERVPNCSSLQVWGERQDDMVFADVILFRDEGN